MNIENELQAIRNDYFDNQGEEIDSKKISTIDDVIDYVEKLQYDLTKHAI